MTLFENEKAKKPMPYGRNMSVFDLLQQIAEGDTGLVQHTKNVRSGTENKGDSFCVTFAGRFDKRGKKGFTMYEPFLNFDIDKIGNIRNELKEKVAKDPHTFAVWDSISGNGITGLFVFDPEDKYIEDLDKAEVIHEERYAAMIMYFKEVYQIDINPAFAEIDNICFLSYDPDIRVNKKCKLFEWTPTKRSKPSKPQPAASPERKYIDFEEVRAAVEQDSLNIYHHYLHDLKEKSGKFWGLCPFHADNTPKNFNIYFNKQKRQYFHKCFACDAKGDALQFIKEIENKDFKGACEAAANILNVQPSKAGKSPTRRLKTSHKAVKPPKPATPEKQAEFNNIYQAFRSWCINAPDTFSTKKKAFEYLLSRGLSAATIKRAGIFVVPDFKACQNALKQLADTSELLAAGLLHKKEDTLYFAFSRYPIILPFFDSQNRIIYLQGRKMPDDQKAPSKYRLLAGRSVPLYGLNELAKLKEGSKVGICEGVLDCLSAWEIGKPAISILSANNFKEDDVKHLKGFKPVLYLDSDEAGKKAEGRLIQLLQAKHKLPTYTTELPAGCKDLNDYLQNHHKPPPPKKKTGIKAHPLYQKFASIFGIEIESRIDYKKEEKERFRFIQLSRKVMKPKAKMTKEEIVKALQTEMGMDKETAIKHFWQLRFFDKDHPIVKFHLGRKNRFSRLY